MLIFSCAKPYLCFKHRFHKKAVLLNKLLPLLCWIGAIKTPQENHHYSTSFDASEGEVAVCTGWEQRTEKQFKNSRGSCSSGESLFSTCNKPLKGEVVTSRWHGSNFSGWQQTESHTVSNFTDVTQFQFYIKYWRTFLRLNPKGPYLCFEKERFLCCGHLLHKAGAWNMEVSCDCRSRATTAKKCTEAWRTCRVVVLLI